LEILYVFLAALVAHITTDRRLADEGAVGYSRALVVEAEVALSWRNKLVAAVVADIATDSGITRVRSCGGDPAAEQEELNTEHLSPQGVTKIWLQVGAVERQTRHCRHKRRREAPRRRRRSGRLRIKTSDIARLGTLLDCPSTIMKQPDGSSRWAKVLPLM
jgi:hypothetical protein